uniref:Putative secreted peptide n=1 Tax=Anopheles braziliensis TaxID=58242 RepID=A0A2M3ZRL9_9DIPT
MLYLLLFCFRSRLIITDSDSYNCIGMHPRLADPSSKACSAKGLWEENNILSRNLRVFFFLFFSQVAMR